MDENCHERETDADRHAGEQVVLGTFADKDFDAIVRIADDAEEVEEGEAGEFLRSDGNKQDPGVELLPGWDGEPDDAGQGDGDTPHEGGDDGDDEEVGATLEHAKPKAERRACSNEERADCNQGDHDDVSGRNWAMDPRSLAVCLVSRHGVKSAEPAIN